VLALDDVYGPSIKTVQFELSERRKISQNGVYLEPVCYLYANIEVKMSFSMGRKIYADQKLNKNNNDLSIDMIFF
jgi:hypothetical protein